MKTLVEKIRFASKKQEELYYAKQVAYEKLRKAYAEHEKAKDIAESLRWDFFAIGAAKEYIGEN